MTRRSVLVMALAGAMVQRVNGQVEPESPWPDWACAPIGWAGEVPGVGFRIGHGFACENTWFAAGWWHTGEDWYALAQDTAGASVYAVATGEVVYADFSYPGRVVIVQHADNLFSMYGHLNPDSVPAQGTQVMAGDQIGTVFQQSDVKGPGQAPSHLHFEIRDFLVRDDVNGNAPQHGVNCGFQCPPGPGYWPQSASTHPADLGWRNPTEAALGRIDPASLPALNLISNLEDLGATLTLWSQPDLGMAEIVATNVFPRNLTGVAELRIGAPDTTETSANGYHVWAMVVTTNDTEGWLRLAVPSTSEVGSDNRPSSVDRLLLFAPVDS
ncbi:MAG TPA: M23 family metallopeptidase [Thermomicrobiales bacterium]|nr:M23 family metallopeptidase [Thermomicrobiales bacterium]